MKIFTSAILMSLFLVMSSSALADDGLQAIQIFECEFEDAGTADQLMAASSAWLKVAKTVNGGENLSVAIRFPIAEGEGSSDFKFVITTPSFAEWGAFTDAYETSDVKKADELFKSIASCSSSTIWEGLVVQ